MDILNSIFLFRWLRKKLPKSSKIAAASNALLAEYSISKIDFVPEKKFAHELIDAIIKVWRVSGFPNINEEEIIKTFNTSTRIEQLNIIAMALNELGHDPKIPNVLWYKVKNPFITNVEDRYIDVARNHFKTSFNIDINLSEKPIDLYEWIRLTNH